jgi:hypothetical protein
LVALQARPELAGCLAELPRGRSPQAAQDHVGLLGGLLACLGNGAGAGRLGAQQPPAGCGKLLGEQGQLGVGEAHPGNA